MGHFPRLGEGGTDFGPRDPLSEQRAYLIEHGKVTLISPIASGKPGWQTPTANFSIFSKDIDIPHRMAACGCLEILPPGFLSESRLELQSWSSAARAIWLVSESPFQY
jgi:hypothetical protein